MYQPAPVTKLDYRSIFNKSAFVTMPTTFHACINEPRFSNRNSDLDIIANNFTALDMVQEIIQH
jgi:hypothetical protein